MCLKYPFSTLVAVTVVTLAIAACSDVPPTMAEIEREARTAQAAQLMRVATATRQRGDLVSALALFRRAHETDPKALDPLIAVGDTAVATASYQEAAEAYRKAVELAPDKAGVRRGYGKTLIALERPDLAIEQFRLALKVNDRDAETHNGLAVAFDLLGDHESAHTHYLDGIEKAPDNLSIRNNYGLSLALAGHYDEAIRILSEIAKDPLANPRNRLNLALVYGLAGSFDKAAEAQRLDLSDADIRSNIEYYERLRGLSKDDRRAAIFGLHSNRLPDFGGSGRPRRR